MKTKQKHVKKRKDIKEISKKFQRKKESRRQKLSKRIEKKDNGEFDPGSG